MTEEVGTLFPELEQPRAPLADRVRPDNLERVIGHTDLIGHDGWLRRAVDRGTLPHLVLWGPPGVGKTTLARLLARTLAYRFEARSAVDVGVSEVREVIKTARSHWQNHQRRTLFFLDEIHRFNKAQQDTLLGDVEQGTVTLVGATTENPAFSLINPLLSRVQVAVLQPLSQDQLHEVLQRALSHPQGLDRTLADAAADAIVHAAGGDARYALSVLETAAAVTDEEIDLGTVQEVLAGNPLRHDRTGDQHYDVVSAWIKTMRGSDLDAALYWAARLWEAGEDRRFLFRRLIIFASEDVGLADPKALELSVAAAEGFERVGEAEGWILFAHVVSYVAGAPKSNTSYAAFKRARALVKSEGALPVPFHLRNAPTELAKELGHAEGYVYPHNEPERIAPQVRYFPEALDEPVLYEPADQGDEIRIADRVTTYRRLRKKHRTQERSE